MLSYRRETALQDTICNQRSYLLLKNVGEVLDDYARWYECIYSKMQSAIKEKYKKSSAI